MRKLSLFIILLAFCHAFPAKAQVSAHQAVLGFISKTTTGSAACPAGTQPPCFIAYSSANPIAISGGGGGGSGTVTSVSVTTANGVSGSVATATTTPAISLTLGAITPTTVNGITITTGTGTFTITGAKTLTVSNTLTFTGTDSSSVAFGGGGTVAYTNVATLSSLASIGTITTGVWNGTRLTSSYIPTDTAYLDVNQSFTAGQAVTPTVGGTQAAGGTYTPDFSLSNSVTFTFGAGNLTVANPTGVKAGQDYKLVSTQDATGGRTITWGANFKWITGVQPTLSTGAGKKDIISCFTDTTTTLNCVLGGNDFR